MLPGFRFLFAAIVLSMSILVFGLGAAALLRAAHEEFASNPTWRAAPETVFAQPVETRPVLALLRVDPPPAQQKAPENIPVSMPAPMPNLTPPAEPAPMASTPPEPAASASHPADELQQVAALKPEASSPPEPVKPEMPAAEPAATSEAAPVQAAPVQTETAASEPAATVPAPAEETKIASSEVAPSAEIVPPAVQAAPAISDPISPPEAPDDAIASTKIATLGGPPVAIGVSPAKLSGAKPEPDKSAVKKRQEARRAAKRRRLAARVAQQTADPFAPVPTITTARKR